MLRNNPIVVLDSFVVQCEDFRCKLKIISITKLFIWNAQSVNVLLLGVRHALGLSLHVALFLFGAATFVVTLAYKKLK